MHNKPIKYVLLDTNIYIQHQYSGRQLIDLASYLKQISGKIIIPDIVRKELETNYKQQLEKERNIVKDLRLLQQNKLLSIKDIKEDGISELSQQKILEPFLYLVDETKSIDITGDVFLDRVIKIMPPFQTSGKFTDAGFKDVLIWEHCKNWLKKHSAEKLAFISNNSNDFGKNKLKSCLLEELKLSECSDRLHYFQSIAQYLESQRSYLQYVSISRINSDLSDIIKSDAENIEKSSLDIDSGYDMAPEDYIIEKFKYEDHNIEEVYISNEDSERVKISVGCSIIFNVLVKVLNKEKYVEWDWDGENGVPNYPPNVIDDATGWVNRAYSVTVNKQSKEVEGIEDEDGNVVTFS